MKTFFIIGSITSFDDPVSPRTRPFDQGVDSARFFNCFGKERFPFWMSRIFHREIHRIIRESYEKGGRLSIAGLYTLATVSVLQSECISEYFQRVFR